jgi:hypothetical protein
MPKIRSIRIDELPALAAAHPEIGKYDPKKKELITPAGETIKVEAGKVGRSEKVYVKGGILEFLKGLDLPELQVPAKEKAGKKKVSLRAVPPRQSTAYRSWGAWFKANPLVDPEDVRKAVQRGYSAAEAEIRRAREALGQARQRMMEATAIKALRGLKKSMTAEQIAELLKRV